MIVIKNERQIERMRISGRIAGEVRDAVAVSVRPGVTTAELADYAAELIGKAGARSAFLGYMDYPGQICISVNEEVVHGIPGPRRIALGDIVSLDVGVEYDGYIGDTATTVMVGVVDTEIIRLVQTAEAALVAGLAQIGAGRRLSDCSHAIEAEARKAGFAVVRQFVGHGVGSRVHEDPQVPNFGRPGRGPKLRSGMTLAIEPMINAGACDVEVLTDGWTAVTKDRKYSAHVEHTVLVTDDGCEILTKV